MHKNDKKRNVHNNDLNKTISLDQYFLRGILKMYSKYTLVA